MALPRRPRGRAGHSGGRGGLRREILEIGVAGGTSGSDPARISARGQSLPARRNLRARFRGRSFTLAFWLYCRARI